MNAGATITVRFVANQQGGMQWQGSPIWPHFEKGESALFPLAPAAVATRSGRAFILSELANALAHGSPTQRYSAAGYLRQPQAEPIGFREVLEKSAGPNEDVWLEVASALLASRGIPQPAGLLKDYGSDEDFNAIISTLRRLKAAAILIDDRRPGFGSLRYCDVAAGTVQRLSGEQIGVKQDMTPVEKDRAVVQASAWLSAHRKEY